MPRSFHVRKEGNKQSRDGSRFEIAFAKKWIMLVPLWSLHKAGMAIENAKKNFESQLCRGRRAKVPSSSAPAETSGLRCNHIQTSP